MIETGLDVVIGIYLLTLGIMVHNNYKLRKLYKTVLDGQKQRAEEVLHQIAIIREIKQHTLEIMERIETKLNT